MAAFFLAVVGGITRAGNHAAEARGAKEDDSVEELRKEMGCARKRAD